MAKIPGCVACVVAAYTWGEWRDSGSSFDSRPTTLAPGTHAAARPPEPAAAHYLDLPPPKSVPKMPRIRSCPTLDVTTLPPVRSAESIDR